MTQKKQLFMHKEETHLKPKPKSMSHTMLELKYNAQLKYVSSLNSRKYLINRDRKCHVANAYHPQDRKLHYFQFSTATFFDSREGNIA